jgi:hypothetical protein
MLQTAEPRRRPDGASAIDGWTLGPRLRSTLVADVFRATQGDRDATVHVLRPEVAALPAVIRALADQAPRAAAIADDRNVLRALGGGGDGARVYVVTEAEGGPTLRDVVARRYAASGSGLPGRGAGNVAMLVAQGLQASHVGHGALSAENVVIAHSGRIAIADLALGPAIAAAIAAGVVQPPATYAPELARGDAPTAASDVYGLGALLYEALTGRPLTRGGPRPSEVGRGVPGQVDDIIARACHQDPERRFGSVAALRELILDILCHGLEDEAEADDEQGNTAKVAALPEARAVPIPPALEAAMTEPDERWLISKGRFDFGPFSMKGLVDQIITGHVHHGHVLFDKDEGGRTKVEDHPLLGPLVEAAKAARDDAARAHAEVEHHARERKRGIALYGGIGLGVLAAAAAVYVLVGALSKAKGRAAAGAGAVAQARLTATVSAPKAPAKRAGGGPRRTGGGSSGGGFQNADESLSLDLSGDDDGGSETLDMDTIYNVYARAGNALGGCLNRTGTSQAQIGIIIDGPSGRVNWVKVNGQTSGPLQGCIGNVMRGLKFPSINGPRSRAEFEISL